MARRNLENKLIDKKDIPEKIKLIEGSLTDYISESGKVYKDYGNGKMFPKCIKPNAVNGYVYVGITMGNRNVSKRVHRLVADAFIPNDDPKNKTVVMHKDNDKTNNNIDNLKWGTISENTKQSFQDGLEANDKSWDDSQSIPVKTIDKNGETIETFGSMREASKITGEDLGLIRYHCVNEVNPNKLRKCKYCFRYITEKDHICHQYKKN